MARPSTYECEMCDGVFEFVDDGTWTEKDAEAEAKANFPELAQADRARVCDECYRKLMQAVEVPLEGDVTFQELELADLSDNDNGNSNARLIAAAPDLLAALRWLVYRGADGHWYVSYREDCPVDFAGAAIAKAEEVKT